MLRRQNIKRAAALAAAIISASARAAASPQPAAGTARQAMPGNRRRNRLIVSPDITAKPQPGQRYILSGCRAVFARGHGAAAKMPMQGIQHQPHCAQ